MPTVVAALVVATTLIATCSFADALFEDVLAVRAKKGNHGHRGMPGDIIQLKDGSLLMSYTHNGDIMGIRSRDLGKTWGAKFVLIPKPKSPAKGRIGAPGFLRVKGGHILMSYIYTTHPATPYFGHTYCRRSNDEGKTWTDPTIMTPYPGYVLVHNDRFFTLASGRIVALAEYKAHFPDTRDHSGYVGMAFYSDDNGYSWHPSRNTVDMTPAEVQEASGVELKDGRVLMFARSYGGFPVFAYSKDGGMTWGKGIARKDITMPYAGLPTVKRIPSTGDLLFIWITERSVDKDNPKVHRRCALTAAISRDEGKTLIHQRHIARDPEDDFGYQSVDFIGKDLAILSYHARDGLHVARIGIEWFYGK